MNGAKLAARLRAVALFVFDFVVGDDWKLAAGVAAALAVTALVSSSGAVSWWLLPAFAGALLAVSVWRASRARG